MINKKTLVDEFGKWILKLEHVSLDNIAIDECAFFGDPFPNSIEGLRFLLSQCSCIQLRKDRRIFPEEDAFEILILGVHFGWTGFKNFTIDDYIKPVHEDGSLVCVFTFREILKDLVINVVERKPIEVEKFLLQNI